MRSCGAAALGRACACARVRARPAAVPQQCRRHARVCARPGAGARLGTGSGAERGRYAHARHAPLPRHLRVSPVMMATLADAYAPAERRAARRIVLVDASPVLYRSFHSKGLAGLRTTSGVPTSAVYGLCAHVLALLESNPHAAAVVFDAPGGSEARREIHDGYKAGRPPMPDELRAQLPLAQEMVELMGVRALRVEGVEADDTIATIAKRLSGDDTLVQIVSSDKDFFQLLETGRVEMLRPVAAGTSEPYTEGDFREDWGLEPAQFLDVLALMGDSADNIPGLKGVGKKTAMKLLAQFGDLESAIANAEQVKGKLAREGLMHNADQARLSRVLAAPRFDVDVGAALGVNTDEDVARALAVDLAGVDVDATHAAMDALQLKRFRPRWDELVEAARIVAAQPWAVDAGSGGGGGGAPAGRAHVDGDFLRSADEEQLPF